MLVGRVGEVVLVSAPERAIGLGVTYITPGWPGAPQGGIAQLMQQMTASSYCHLPALDLIHHAQIAQRSHAQGANGCVACTHKYALLSVASRRLPTEPNRAYRSRNAGESAQHRNQTQYRNQRRGGMLAP
jgi:hypothetical protein